MTVSELIAELEKMPQEKQAMVNVGGVDIPIYAVRFEGSHILIGLED